MRTLTISLVLVASAAVLGEARQVMTMGAVVTGQVLDAAGRPIAGAQVDGFHMVDDGWGPQLRATRSMKTDANGRYEWKDPSPDPVILAVRSVPTESTGGLGANAAVMGYPTTFYPHALAASKAEPIPLVRGQRTEVNLQLTQLPSVPVSGRVDGLTSASTSLRARLLIDPPDPLAPNVPVTETAIGSNGRFVFPRVPAGDYRIAVVQFPVIPRPADARLVMQFPGIDAAPFVTPLGAGPMPIAPMSPEPCLWSEAPIHVVDTQLNDVAIQMQAGARIRGRVEFDPPAAAPATADLNRMMILVVPVDGHDAPSVQVARIETDRRFVTASLPPGKYYLDWRLNNPREPQRWSDPAVIVDGRELPDGAIDLGSADVTRVTIKVTALPRVGPRH